MFQGGRRTGSPQSACEGTSGAGITRCGREGWFWAVQSGCHACQGGKGGRLVCHSGRGGGDRDKGIGVRGEGRDFYKVLGDNELWDVEDLGTNIDMGIVRGSEGSYN